VTYTPPATDAFGQSLQPVCTKSSGSTFAIGDTQVTCTATDAADHATSASFTVHVKGAAEQISDQIALVGSRGDGSFADQLQLAQDALAAGDKDDACGNLAGY